MPNGEPPSKRIALEGETSQRCRPLNQKNEIENSKESSKEEPSDSMLKLEKRMQEALKTVSDLNDQMCSDFETQLAASNQNLETANARIQQLEGEARDAEEKHRQEVSARHIAENNARNLEEENRILEAQMNDLRSSHAKELEKLKEELKVAKNKEKTLVEADQKLQDALIQNAQMTELLNAFKETWKAVEVQWKTVNEKLANAEADASVLRTNLERVTREKDAMEGGYQQQISALEAEIKELKEVTVRDLTASNKLLEESEQKLQGQVESLLAKGKNLEKEMDVKTKRIEKLEQEVKTMKWQVSDAETNKEACSKDILKLQNAADNRSKELTELRWNYESLQAKYDTQEEHIKNLRNNKELNKRRIADLEKEKKQLKADKEASEVQISSARTEIASLKGERKLLGNDVATLRSELEAKNETIDQLNNRVDKLMDQLNDAEQALTRAKSSICILTDGKKQAENELERVKSQKPT